MVVKIVFCAILVSIPLALSRRPHQLDRAVVLDNQPDEVQRLITSYGSFDEMKNQVYLMNKRIESELNESGKPKDAETISQIIKAIPRKEVDLDAADGAVVLFLLLEFVRDACDQASYVTLAADYKLLIGDRHYLSGDSPLEILYLDTLKQHGDNCRSGYYDRFKTVQLNKEVSQQLDKLFTDEVMDFLIGPGRYEESVLRMRNTPYKLQYVENQPVDLCRYYIQSIQDIFYPAKIDLTLDISKISEINPTEDKEFMAAWTKFHICSTMVAFNMTQSL